MKIQFIYNKIKISTQILIMYMIINIKIQLINNLIKM